MEMANKAGVRARAQAQGQGQALALAAAAASRSSRKRKVYNCNNERLVMNIDLRSSSSRRRRVTVNNSAVSRQLNSGQRTTTTTSNGVNVDDNRCCSPSLDSDHDASASCCCSIGSSHDDHQGIIFADLQEEKRSVEVETSGRENSTPSSELGGEELSSDELDSTARLSSSSTSTSTSTSTEANSPHLRGSSTSTVVGKKMPTESELDEFFAEAETNIQKQFADKYNYDVVKDEPLKGRYEWVRLKPRNI